MHLAPPPDFPAAGSSCQPTSALRSRLIHITLVSFASLIGAHGHGPLSRLASSSSGPRGFARFCAESLWLSRPIPLHTSSSAQAGRLSLPACAEEAGQGRSATERRSLSAQQKAEPQVNVRPIERNVDKTAWLCAPTHRPGCVCIFRRLAGWQHAC